MRADISEARRKGWATRRDKYGPRGHSRVQPWRRKPNARAKRIAAQSLASNVKRETSEDRFTHAD
jgi:hypothetical protein